VLFPSFHFIHYQSVSWHVQSLFQSDLELSPSDVSILSFPEGNPVASYVFFLVFLSLLSFLLFFLR
jgi:hypothetical protein